jgi:hypothetical protein
MTADRALASVVPGRARCLTFPRKRFVRDFTSRFRGNAVMAAMGAARRQRGPELDVLCVAHDPFGRTVDRDRVGGRELGYPVLQSRSATATGLQPAHKYPPQCAHCALGPMLISAAQSRVICAGPTRPLVVPTASP